MYPIVYFLERRPHGSGTEANFIYQISDLCNIVADSFSEKGFAAFEKGELIYPIFGTVSKYHFEVTALRQAQDREMVDPATQRKVDVEESRSSERPRNPESVSIMEPLKISRGVYPAQRASK